MTVSVRNEYTCKCVKNMNWYILYTACKAEKQVEQRILGEGVEVYLPLHLAPRRWSDRVKLVEVPLFQSYIFVHTTDEVLRMLNKITGVARIVYYNGAPAVVRDSEIMAIRTFCEKAQGLECSFSVNEEVLIACGPLKNMQGRIKRTSNGQLLLHIPQIGMTVCVHANQVVKRKLCLR